MGDGLTEDELNDLLGGLPQGDGFGVDAIGGDIAEPEATAEAVEEWPEDKEYPTLYSFGDGANEVADPDGVDLTHSVVRDIYRRHGIPLDVELPDAVMMIEQRAGDAKAGQSMWANPTERAEARGEYASNLPSNQERLKWTDAELAQRRWDDSSHLMDPETAKYHQNYVRDQDFLVQLLGEPEIGNVDEMTATHDKIGPHVKALEYWDRSRNSPLWSDYARNSEDGLWIAHALTDPDSTVGSTMMFLEQGPNAIRMRGSGESDGWAGAWKDQRALHRANQRYRITSPAPIGNLPSEASAEDRSRAIADLQRQVGAAAIPGAAERWARTTGWVPPGIVQDIGDGLISALDPTFAIPVGGSALKGLSLAAKGAKVAGTGWVKPAMQQLGRQTAAGLGWDQASEQTLNLGIPAAISPETAGGRWTSTDYWTPRMAKPGDAKQGEELEAAKEARKQLYESADPESVSAADAQAYDEVKRQFGIAPYAPRASANKER